MGSILVNVVATELIILICYVLLLILGVDSTLTIRILLAEAILFPLAFYHHGWSLWLSFNHLVNPLPKLAEDGLDTFIDE